jgi:hypothetical protein
MQVKKVKDLEIGDRTKVYEVVGVPVPTEEESGKFAHGIVVDVVYLDGGTGRRFWDDPETEIEIKDPEGVEGNEGGSEV